MITDLVRNGISLGRLHPFHFAVILLAIVISFAGVAMAQDNDAYIIGVADVLSITFWQEPDLNTDARVGENGLITLPVIGQIRAAGLSTSQLAKNIVEQLAFYHTPISQATVAVIEFNSRSVVVTGEVLEQSTQRYEKIPDMWRVILDAGGPTESADLSRVTIIRKVGERSEVIEVDLLEIIKGGDLSKAPLLLPGDLINVRSTPFGEPLDLGDRPVAGARNIYFVVGSVATPGVRNLDAEIDVLDAITLAGGPTTDADLSNVRVVIKGPEYSSIVKIDLEKYIATGSPPRLVLHPEDTVVIPARRTSVFSSIFETATRFIPIIAAVGTMILLFR